MAMKLYFGLAADLHLLDTFQLISSSFYHTHTHHAVSKKLHRDMLIQILAIDIGELVNLCVYNKQHKLRHVSHHAASAVTLLVAFNVSGFLFFTLSPLTDSILYSKLNAF